MTQAKSTAKPLWETGERDLMIKSAVETALPAHMLWTMSQGVLAAGYLLRPDIQHRLNVGAAASLASLARDRSAISEAATRVDELGRRLLNELAPDQAVHGMYVVAAFALRLVEEGLYADVENVGIFTSMLLMDDLKEHGGAEDYVHRERVLTTAADGLIRRARAEGVYDIGMSETPQLTLQ